VHRAGPPVPGRRRWKNALFDETCSGCSLTNE
jgi:hypothetical protein